MFATVVGPMSPSDQWLFDTLNSMRQEGSEQHQRLRSDMNAGFDKLREEMRRDRAATAHIEKDVLVLKTNQLSAEKAAGRRQWGIGILAGGLVSFLIKAVDWWQGR